MWKKHPKLILRPLTPAELDVLRSAKLSTKLANQLLHYFTKRNNEPATRTEVIDKLDVWDLSKLVFRLNTELHQQGLYFSLGSGLSYGSGRPKGLPDYWSTLIRFYPVEKRTGDA